MIHLSCLSARLRAITRSLVVGAAFGALIPTASHAQRTWEWMNPAPQANYLKGIAYGNGSWVAVGDAGVIIAKTGDEPFKVVVLGIGGLKTYNDVTFDDGRFVAVGSIYTQSRSGNSLVATSTDGLSWVETILPQTAQLTTAAYGNGTWVISGSSATVLWSTDTLTWTQSAVPNSVGSWLNMDYANGEFAAPGIVYTNGSSKLVIWHSADGKTFTRTDTTFSVQSASLMTGGGGKWIVSSQQQSPWGGIFYSSSNLIDWQVSNVVTNTSVFEDLTYGGGRFVASSGTIATSTDGVTWETGTSSFPTDYQTGMATRGLGYGNGLFAGVGDRGRVQTSTDGKNWTHITQASLADFKAIATNGSRLVAVADKGYVLSSDDGNTWTERNSSYTPANGMTLNDVVYADGKFILVGDNPYMGQSAAAASSPDGITWTRVATGGVSITHGAGRFVAVGRENSLRWSTDGTTWNNASQKPSKLWLWTDVEFGSGAFVAIGGNYINGVLVTSTDGDAWTEVAMGEINNFDFLAYGGGKFVVIGRRNTTAAPAIFVSENGTTWTEANTAAVIKQTVFGAFFHDGTRFLLIGRESAYSSRDGITWKSLGYGVPFNNSITDGLLWNGVYTVVGDWGTIMRSHPSALVDATDVGNGIYQSWLGFVYARFEPWIYHFDLGWLYLPGTTASSAFIFSPTEEWLWSGESIYPFLYSFKRAAWLYYGEDKVLYVYDNASNTWSPA
ncbi:MAG: hypothetical protein SFY80_01485 [Verrucomicrobiota bacterium]|nr:hypothetical protein [Verrucomicrobiota bacterium]